MNIMPKIKPIALVSLLVLVGFGASPCRAQMIDDFESYADSAALNSAWSATGAVVTLDTTTPNDGGGTQSANVSWQNVPGNSGYGFNLTLATPADWTGETLSVWVRRQSTSASTTNFFFMLMDTTMGICPSGPDLSVTDTNWHLYSYDLSAP